MKTRVLIAVAALGVAAVPLLWSWTTGGAPTHVAVAKSSTAKPRAEALAQRTPRIPHVGAVATPPTPETLNTWFAELPRAEDLPADVHFAPPAIGQAGERFGFIFDAVHQNPAFRPEAAQFFGRCTEDAHVLDGIRALCLHNWRTFRAATDTTEPQSDERIRRIADFLPKHPSM